MASFCSLSFINLFPNKPWFLRVCSKSLCNEQFLLFPQCFLSIWKHSAIFINLKLSSANSFSLEESADDNFKFDENGRKFFKRVENTAGKREIAHYEQLSFSNGVFKRLAVQIPLVTTRLIPYLHQTSSILRKSPLELLSALLE